MSTTLISYPYEDCNASIDADIAHLEVALHLVDAAVAALALVSPCVAYRREARRALDAARFQVEQAGLRMHFPRSDLPDIVSPYIDLWVSLEKAAERERRDAGGTSAAATPLVELDELRPGVSRQRRRGVGR